MIKLSHVYKTYAAKHHALRDVNLEINKGEFVFLTGPSGAGKSTLFKLLTMMDRPTSGDVQVGDFNIAKIKETQLAFFRRRLGVVFQDFKLINDLTIKENISLPLKFKNERNIEHKVNEIMYQLGIESKANEYPEYVSGGEKQRTAIARALVHQPNIVIADEPTGNLDPELSFEIMNIFSRVCAQGTTVVVASHDLNLVKKMNKKVIHLNHGIII